METYSIKSKKYFNLTLLRLNNDTYAREGELSVIKDQNGNIQLVKRLFYDNKIDFDNKLYTIKCLLDNKEKINNDQLILPNKFLSVDGNICGYTMDYIPGLDLGYIIKNFSYSIKDKIKYLKQVGKLLEDLKKFRKYSKIKDFYLNDIHENNFVLNTITDKIAAVDLDSCKIEDNLSSEAKYLTQYSVANNCSKYKKDPNKVGGIFSIDDNTEMYAYIIMILKFFSGEELDTLSIETFYDYLSYLQSIKVPTEILDIFSNIYLYKDNENPYEILDCLEPYYGKSLFKVYEYKKERRCYK